MTHAVNRTPALVMSGGGSRGSWEAGFLGYLAQLPLPGFGFVSGTSVGSINAAGVAMFPPDRFADGAAFVERMWTDHVTRTRDIWRVRRPLGIPSLWRPSVGVNDALHALLTSVLDLDAVRRSGVRLRLPAVDLESGELVEFTEEDLDTYGVLPVMASASYPIAFPPVEVGARWLTDGGVIDMAPLGAAIDQGADRILVLATRSPDGVAPKPRAELQTALRLTERVFDIMVQEILRGDLRVCQSVNLLIEAGHPSVAGKRHVDVVAIGPSRPLGGSLDFSGELMRAQMALGRADARRAHEDGSLAFLLRDVNA